MVPARATLALTLALLLSACGAQNDWGPGGGSSDPGGGSSDPGGGSSDPGGGAPRPGDADGDGYLATDGDCDDSERSINPMAVEVAGNLRDDDCDGAVDEAPETCDCAAGATLPAGLDLCDPRFLLSWEERFTAPRGETAAAVSARYGNGGNGLAVRSGCAYTILATAPVDTQGCSWWDPEWCAESPRQPGIDYHDDGMDRFCGSEGGIPGEADPNPAGADGADVCDVHQLVVHLRVPSNAIGFSFDFVYLSAEYPEWVDQGFNDTFYAIVDRPAAGERQNISFDDGGHEIEVDNAFFEDPPRTDLGGTGYDGTCTSGRDYSRGVCGSSTGWLRTSWTVTPGEELTLTFSIHDEGDGFLDSAVILDGFAWSTVEVTPGTDLI